ncbi:hypothetical protein [Blastococcus sp. SYSU D00813]
MTAATAPAAVRETVVGRGTIAALARAEVRRTLRSPLLWAGTALAAWSTWYVSTDGSFTGGRPVTDGYAVWEWGAFPLTLTAFLLGNWGALRERPSTTAELFSNTPARRWDRTLGLLAAAAVPALLSLVLIAGQYVAVLAQGGARLGEGRWSSEFTPSPLELLGAPLAVACSFVAGVALARLVRSRAVGAVLGFVGWVLFFVAFWVWFTAPFGVLAVSRSPLAAADLGTDPSAAELASYDAVDPPGSTSETYLAADRDLGFYGLHLVYVAGLVVLLAGVALARSGRDRRTRPVLLTGAVLVVLGVAGQLLVHESARTWLGFM